MKKAHLPRSASPLVTAAATRPTHSSGLAFEQMSDARYAHLLNHLHIIEAWQLGDVRTEVPASKVRFTVKE